MLPEVPPGGSIENRATHPNPARIVSTPNACRSRLSRRLLFSSRVHYAEEEKRRTRITPPTINTAPATSNTAQPPPVLGSLPVKMLPKP